jgi:MFS family permease
MTTTVPPTPTPPPATARGWLPPLLRETPFRRYWSAHTVSQFGDQVSLLALPLLAVLATDAGPAQMGYLTAAALAPSLLFSLLAGAVIDRFRAKRRVMIAADIGRALLLALVPIAYALGELRLAHLYAVAFGVGTLAVLFEVSQTTLFVSLVPRSRYVDANTLLNGSRALSHVAGPSAGGVLVQALTAPVALVVDAVSYLCSAVFLARIRPVEPAPAQRRGLGIGEGLGYLVRSPVLRATMFGTTTLNLFNFMFAALFVLYASTELAVSPGVLGAVLGVGALGGLLGAALAGPISRRLGIGRTAVAGMVLFPLPLVLVPLAGGPAPLVLTALLAAEFLAGFGVMILDISIGSVQTAFTPATMLARVAGAKRTINFGIRPIGALLGGALGATLGVRPTLWIATVGALAGLLWLLPSPVPAMRTLPEQPVD